MSKKNALFPQVKENIAFDNLWQQAAEMIDTLSGDIWTDRADHDPGVTLLQAATWNCSDLSYRASLSLNDLLTREGESTLFPADFGPHLTLTCNTVTPEDYRRALLDLHTSDIPDLELEEDDFLFSDVSLVAEPEDQRFHWWYNRVNREYSFSGPADGQETDDEWKKLTLRGNYWLYLIPTRLLHKVWKGYKKWDKENWQKVLNYLDAFLSDHRNLGERVSEIHWLGYTTFDPEIEIELDDNEQDPGQLIARIYKTIERLVMPPVLRYSTEELRAQGYSSEEIFTGPLLRHGWQLPGTTLIRDHDEKGYIINLDALSSELLAIEGVASITRFTFQPSTIPGDGIQPVDGQSWSWWAPNGSYPLLWGTDPIALLASDNSPLTLNSKGGIAVTAKPDEIKKWLTPPELIHTTPVTLEAGQRRDLFSYTPVGDRLPECYQLQQPDMAIDNQVRELHQFLLPLDQQLADGCAELASACELLAFTGRGKSLDDNDDHTEKDTAGIIRGTQWPYREDSDNRAVHNDYAQALQDYQRADVTVYTDPKKPDNFLRELEFLNYLLSYFGTRGAARPLTLGWDDFLATERAYLEQQPSLGYDRINIRIDQVSSLQKRIAGRIGLSSECFAEQPDLGNLPFYVIEHRQLLPLIPDESYNEEQTPSNYSTETLNEGKETQVTLTQPGSAGKIATGQLIDLYSDNEANKVTVGRLLVIETSGDDFTVSTVNSQQLANDLARLQQAWDNKELRWKNSNVWLQDMDYRLSYAEEDQQPQASDERLLISGPQSPFPSMVNEGDIIVISKADPMLAGSGRKKQSKPATADEALLTAQIIKVDAINQTLTIKKVKDESQSAKEDIDFPAYADAWKYQWNFKEAAYATMDRFSFVVSIVHNREFISGTNITDPQRLINWLQQTVMAEFPAHISLINHWLSESDFRNFAATYKRWQDNRSRLGDDAYSILKMLTLGHLPETHLGIGLMRIATDAQQAEATQGGKQDLEYINENELLYVPENDPSAV